MGFPFVMPGSAVNGSLRFDARHMSDFRAASSTAIPKDSVGAAGEHELRERLLDEALAHGVPLHGWSLDALTLAAQRLGLSPAATGILPRWAARHF
jgi:ubiquinone biosynthesis protein COQ9